MRTLFLKQAILLFLLSLFHFKWIHKVKKINPLVLRINPTIHVAF
nr:MAG TPA: hypothetical protein [Caudoviricetes sp.]